MQHKARIGPNLIKLVLHARWIIENVKSVVNWLVLIDVS
jgi:hypothetical protein